MPSALPPPYLSIGEIEPGEGKPFSHTGPREYKRRFHVRVSDKSIGPVEVCECPGLPLPYNPYVVDPARGESDLSALLVEMDAKPANKSPGDWGNWIVSCQYSTDLRSGQGTAATNFPNKSGGAQNNPEFEPPEIEWDFQEMQRSFTKDLDGKPFLNSANHPLNPVPVVDIAYPVLIITRNELSFSRTNASRYAYAVNDRAFLTADAGSAQCLPPKARITYKGNLSYWRVTYRIRFCVPLLDGSLLSWQPVINDNGLEELVLKPGEVFVPRPVGFLGNDEQWKRTQISKFQWLPIYKGGHPTSQPVLLDGNGMRLKPNNFGLMVPFELKFRVYRSLDFTDLFVRGIGG